jgi:hypothetical protein
MGLPKPIQTVFNTTIKETNTLYKFRPFVMKDERSILTAKALGDDDAVRDTIENVVQSCLVDEKIIASELGAHIVDYLYIQMYSKSNIDMLPVTYTCVNDVEEKIKQVILNEDGVEEEVELDIVKKCGHESQNHLDLKRVKIEYPENYEQLKNIKVSDAITLNMEYPKSKTMREWNKVNALNEFNEFLYTEEERQEANSNVIFESIVSITEKLKDDGESIRYPTKDFNKEEFFEWLDELPKNVTEDLTIFFSKLPQIKLVSTMLCQKCYHKEEFVFIGAPSFLALS